MKPGKLTNEIRTFVVQALACFDTPAEVAEVVNDKFGVKITPQSIEAYDPTKAAGARLSNRWRAMFDATRAGWLAELDGIAICHRSYRLKALGRMARSAESMGNFGLAAQLLEQAAREAGGDFVRSGRRRTAQPKGFQVG